MNILNVWWLTAALSILSFSAFGLAAQNAQKPENPVVFSADDVEFGEVFVLSVGGKLYDNLWTMTDAPEPDIPNPDFPKNNEAAVGGTWRCVTCHGWDYSGADGERGQFGDLKTFPSLRHLEGMDLQDAARLIKSSHPKYPIEIFDEALLEVLALFVSAGQYDRQSFLGKDGKAAGNPEGGRPIFEGSCMNCHQYDGKASLVGEPGDKSSLGWISRNRPEQALHKIMNGVPGADMLAVRFLEQRQIADLLAFLQTLDPHLK